MKPVLAIAAFSLGCAACAGGPEPVPPPEQMERFLAGLEAPPASQADRMAGSIEKLPADKVDPSLAAAFLAR